ncbi:cd7 antigen-like [Corythoichthys intestinalis]|uniref:cd7 antigen-like n=1 Tax=Corythoichthys intestinalis TaxID=161448 RepID=UPI0025A540B5|nr:cd7 antigen-like [Corythoichthys intestinalis]
MSVVHHLWILLVIHSVLVCGGIQFLEQHEGDSVVLPCTINPRGRSPVGFALKRMWQDPRQVLFKYTNSDAHVNSDADKPRLMVAGDPSNNSLTVTLSELRANDTDHYTCEFVVPNRSSEDEHVVDTEFFLLVNAVTLGRIDVCAGGSAVIPCLPPHDEDLPVEGVSLMRRRGRAPIELLYHTKRHIDDGSTSTSRFQLWSAPGPSGFTYNLTLRHLQSEDSGVYSCQLLLRRQADTSASLDMTKAVFVSVEGGPCGCSNYATLLYALSSAVVVLLVLLTLIFIYHKRAQRLAASRPLVPIYEEMTGVKNLGAKQDDDELSVYKNGGVKKSCPLNHYETPIRSAF